MDGDIDSSGGVQRGKREILAVFRRHPVAMLKGLILALVGLIVIVLGLFFRVRLDLLAAIGFIFGILFMLQLAGWWFSLIILSSGGLEIVTQKGLFKRGVVDIPFESIINTNYSSSGLMQAMLGFGTIIIQTQSGDIVLEKVAKPANIHKRLVKEYNVFRGFDEEQD
jgi:uncharacterized membrane protein YdbT with pleckstrin-like domain